MVGLSPKVTIMCYLLAINVVDKEISYIELGLRNNNEGDNQTKWGKVDVITSFGNKISLNDMFHSMSIRDRRTN